MTQIHSLRTRARSIAGLVLLLVVVLGLFSLWRLNDYSIIVSEIRERYLQNTQFLGDLNNSTSDFRAAEAAALLASTPSDINENDREIRRLDTLIATAQRSFEHVNNDATTTKLYDDFTRKWREYRHQADQVFALSRDKRQDEGVALHRTSSRRAYDDASDALGVLTERNRNAASDSSARAARAYREARYLTAFAVVVAGLIVIGALVHIRRTILRPLLDLASRMRRLTENKMDIETEGIERADEVGEMARAVMVFRNNAVELANSQRALEQQASMLSEKLAHEQHLAELQRNFVSMASHEFRSPLNIIDGQAQRLINAADRLTPDDIAQRARNVRAAVRRMTSVIDNLIDASRLMDGQPDLYFHPTEFDLAVQLRDICQSHRELTPRAQITEHAIDRPVPIIADQKLLSQVFHNIIANAVKYSPEGIFIDVSVGSDEEHVTVTIADRGLGIPRSDRHHLFQRYYRGSNVTGIVGSGIGLYLVKTVVDLHKGRVFAESEEGKGARFIVKIPALAAAADAVDIDAHAAG
jgi:signal transduction histidine kinase